MRRQATVRNRLTVEHANAKAESSISIARPRVPHAAKVAATWETDKKGFSRPTWTLGTYISSPKVHGISTEDLISWVRLRQTSFTQRLGTAIRNLRRQDLSGKPQHQRQAEMLEVAWDVWQSFAEGLGTEDDYVRAMSTLESEFQGEDWGALAGFDMRLLHRTQEAATWAGLHGLPPGDLGIYEHPIPELGDLVCLRHPWVWRRRPPVPGIPEHHDWGWLVLGSLETPLQGLRLGFDLLYEIEGLTNKDIFLPALGLLAGTYYSENADFFDSSDDIEPWRAIYRNGKTLTNDSAFTVRIDTEARSPQYPGSRGLDLNAFHLNPNLAGMLIPSAVRCPRGSDVVDMTEVLVLMNANEEVFQVLRGHENPAVEMMTHLGPHEPVGVIATARVPYALYTTFTQDPQNLEPETWFTEFEPFIYGKLRTVPYSSSVTAGTRGEGFGVRTGVPVIWSDSGNMQEEESGYRYRIAWEGHLEPDPTLAWVENPHDEFLWRWNDAQGWVKHPYERLYGTVDEGRQVGVLHTPEGDLPIIADFRPGQPREFAVASRNPEFVIVDGAYKLTLVAGDKSNDRPVWQLIRWEIRQAGPDATSDAYEGDGVPVERTVLRDLLPTDTALPRGETFLVWANATLSDPKTNKTVAGFEKPHRALRDVLPFLLPLHEGFPLARSAPANPRTRAVKPTSPDAKHVARLGTRDVAAVDRYDGMALYQRLLDLVREGELKPGQPSQCRMYRRGHLD